MVKWISQHIAGGFMMRKSNYDIESTFLNRWSPRSFDRKEVPEEALLSVFEAARWAPSANNEQPWRFIVARKKEDLERFYSFIFAGNRVWCENAPVLAVVLSKKINSKGASSMTHSFDAGAAWAMLALEAVRQGLATHAMGGFEREKARITLGVPEDFDLHAVIAIGYRGEKGALPEDLQAREHPSDRRPLADTLFEGKFAQAAE
jgi:nitroreductase